VIKKYQAAKEGHEGRGVSLDHLEGKRGRRSAFIKATTRASEGEEGERREERERRCRLG